MPLVKPFLALSINENSHLDHETHFFASRLNAVLTAMERHHHHQPARHAAKTRPVTAVTPQVVEISDDESDDATETDSAFESYPSSEDADSPPPRRDLLHLHKRPKLQPTLPGEPT